MTATTPANIFCGKLGRLLFAAAHRRQCRRWLRRRKKQLDEGRIEQSREVPTQHPGRLTAEFAYQKVPSCEAAYFEGHAERMRYAEHSAARTCLVGSRT